MFFSSNSSEWVRDLPDAWFKFTPLYFLFIFINPRFMFLAKPIKFPTNLPYFLLQTLKLLSSCIKLCRSDLSSSTPSNSSLRLHSPTSKLFRYESLGIRCIIFSPLQSELHINNQNQSKFEWSMFETPA